jgi:hypothetical protein
MVTLSTTQTGASSGAAPYLFPLSESRALLVAVTDAIGTVYDAEHLQHCVYLGQEFRVLRGRRYWFAPSGTGLPYSHILEDDIRELLMWGVLEHEPERAGDRPSVLGVCYDRFTLPERMGEISPRITALSGLSREEIAALAGAVFYLSRQGRHPAHRRFHTALRASLLSRDEDGVDGTAGGVERICAACEQLGSEPPRTLAPAYAY